MIRQAPAGMERLVSFNAHNRAEATDQLSPDEILARMEDAEEAALAGQEVDADSLRDIPLDALSKLVRFILGTSSTAATSRRTWNSVPARIAVLAHALQLEEVGTKSFQQLGDEIGVSRASLSLYSVRLMDTLGVTQLRSSKSRKSREVYRENALQTHAKHNRKLTGNHKETRPFSYME